MTSAGTVTPQAVAPQEAIRFFRDKGYAIGFDWRDVWQSEHAVAFTVAKAMSLDILEDIRNAVDLAIADGISFRDFEAHLGPILQAKGWWGRSTMIDPLTGESVSAQLGSRRRLGIIYDTNIRTAHASGQWERIQRLKDRRPWLRYVAVMDERTRADHRRWNGTVLPADDPWWQTHFPPNGWRCRCTVDQLSDRDLTRYGFEPSSNPPPTDMRPWLNKRTGRVEMVPDGIDPGFANNPGMIDRQAEAESRLAEKRALVVTPARPAGGADAGRIAQIAGEAKRYVLDNGRATGNEFLDGYDLDTGQVLERFSGGEADRVRLPQALVEAISDRARRIVLHHNHPIPASFSEQDLRLLCLHPGVARMLAHALDGSDFSAVCLRPRGMGGLTDLPVLRAIQEATYSVDTPVWEAIRRGEIDRSAYDLLVPHLRAQALARRGIIAYDFSLSDDLAALMAPHEAMLAQMLDAAEETLRRRNVGWTG